MVLEVSSSMRLSTAVPRHMRGIYGKIPSNQEIHSLSNQWLDGNN